MKMYGDDLKKDRCEGKREADEAEKDADDGVGLMVMQVMFTSLGTGGISGETVENMNSLQGLFWARNEPLAITYSSTRHTTLVTRDGF